MKIVLDTCCAVATLPRGLARHWFWYAFRRRLFTLCVTTEMLEEYDEILSRLYSSAQSNKVINELVTAPNVEKVTVYYNWYLIADPDDNKFVDCAVAANAHAIVTHDRHFRKLKYTEFPELQVFNLQQFKSILQGREGGEDIFEW